MDCESPTSPYGMPWSVYYARIKCRYLTGWREAYILRCRRFFIETNTRRTTWNLQSINVTCRRIFEFILKSSMPCVAPVQSACTMDIDTGTWTVYRVCNPTMTTRKWLAQYMHVPSYCCSWQRLSISMITSILSPAICIGRCLPQSIVTDNIYR